MTDEFVEFLRELAKRGFLVEKDRVELLGGGPSMTRDEYDRLVEAIGGW